MSATLHERIRGDFEARILSGELAPGARLPTEQAVQAQYGCSRMTVSKALSALAAAGLIDRRRRAGTFVARPRAHSMILDVPDLAAEVAERGQAYRYHLLTRRRSRDAEGAALHLVGVHEADGAPLAFEDRTVSVAMAPGVDAVDFTIISPGAWLLRHVPWTEAETRIAAVGADPEAASALGLRAGAPCLCIHRRTWRGAHQVTLVRQIFPADSYEVFARFGPTPA